MDDRAPWEPRVRWLATITYRSDGGPIEVEHHLRELADLHDLVERGPHWDTIVEIRIIRAELTDGPLTIEEAAQI